MLTNNQTSEYMSVLIVTYDLDKETTNKDYQAILKEIKSYAYARLSESSYAIYTAKTPNQIYNSLEGHLDSGDLLLVLTLKQPYYGQHSQNVVDWLEKYLD